MARRSFRRIKSRRVFKRTVKKINPVNVMPGRGGFRL